MKNVLKNAVAKIKKEHIKPESRHKYLLKKYGIWSIFVLALVFGAISFAIMFAILIGLDWDLYAFMRKNPIVYAFSLIPYLWLVIVGIFLFLTFLDLRKTEKGYRLSWGKILVFSIGGIVGGGLVLAYLGIGNKFNVAMMKNFPVYAQHMVTKEAQWMQPEKGLLAGTIKQVSANALVIEDLQGFVWHMQINSKTVVRPAANIAEGQMIKIIGNQIGAAAFEVFEIRPWTGIGMNGYGRGMKMKNGANIMRQ